VPGHDRPDEGGIALVVALMAMFFIVALGTALVLTTTTESKVTRNFKNGLAALYAADGAAERTMTDLLLVQDWNTWLSGNATSPFVDGPPTGTRSLPGGAAIDLAQVLSLANCRKATACSISDMDAVTRERPWGPNNPRWRMFAYGPLDSIAPTGTVKSPFYVVVMVGDDPSEADNNPWLDGGAPVAPASSNPGLGVLALRAEAFGPFGAHRAIEVTVARIGTAEAGPGYVGQPGVRALSWREVR
jgi:hypothetical protein